ncbi:SlyX family protein [Hydrogenovibrio kuenenii]|uniref:SlyX family protein n=1 Tax=Hydrogenovibrio kuenenii TaxID=63658 RepID=UPI000466E3F8|nr:SlyX family protein [Hydrogenovibrio kuenenii]
MANELEPRVSELEEKILHLEIHQAYQDETADQLNHLVAKQQQDINELKHQLKVLSEFLRNMKSEAGSQIKLPSEETPPPHY